MPINAPVYVGTDGTTTVQFNDPTGAAFDPPTVTMSFSLGSGLGYTVWTYGGAGSITKLGVGNYKAIVDTSPGESTSSPDLTVVWRGTPTGGGAGVVGVASVKLQQPPA